MTRPQSASVIAAISDIKAGMMWRDAAKKHGVAQSSIKRAMDRANIPICPCCGQKVKNPPGCA